METVITIIILFVVIFLGKFIYDTYLTDNTEHNFEAYRKIDPVGAAKIEQPRTQKQFNNLVKSIENNLPINSENLSILFSDLMKKLPLMKISTDSPTKLELESVGSNPLFIISINQKPQDHQFYFNTSYIYIDSIPVSSDKFLLGSRASVNSNPPNWDRIISDSIDSIGMKNTHCELEDIITEEQKKLSLRFDGYYYWNRYIVSVGSILVLRFYPNGLVSYANAFANSQHSLTSSFNPENQQWQNGNYSLKNHILEFDVYSGLYGSISYVGYLKDDKTIKFKVIGNYHEDYEADFIFMQADENGTYTISLLEYPEKHD